MAKYLLIANIDLQCDSQLVAAQLRGMYEAKNERMERIEVTHVLKTENQMADKLANLVTDALYPCNVEISVMEQLSFQGTTAWP